ncbi:cache domain-containing protein [uncultured Desulfosarcina sp.]|uniref:cache domain-containing protein n=1 Tax=uncultured Desulfosarcina sp. TaxID=218289 RepID=UPI0029C8D69D|nr:cache domain-containing protein [uncultured Desulfosarcina sp.]
MYFPIEKNKIRLYYYFGSVSSIIFLSLLFSLIYTRSINKEFDKKTDQLSMGIINEKKEFLNNAVNRTIFLIETEREIVRQEFTSRGLSQDQMDNISVERISNHIRKLRLIDDGYIWVNRIVDYQGGERYAIRQIHPNLPNTEGQWLSTNTTDIKGNRPYEVELNGVKEKGEIYFEYYFKKLSSDKIAHKMSYAKLYKPWDWVVAAGVYLDDVDELIQRETQNMERTLKSQRIYTFSIASMVLLISIVILIRFEKQIVGLVNSYEHDIKLYTDNLIDEKEKTQAAMAEIKQLKGLLPICSNCKKIRDDSGYWNQIESFIREHSEAEFSHGICPDCVKKLYPYLDISDQNDTQR